MLNFWHQDLIFFFERSPLPNIQPAYHSKPHCTAYVWLAIHNNKLGKLGLFQKIQEFLILMGTEILKLWPCWADIIQIKGGFGLKSLSGLRESLFLLLFYLLYWIVYTLRTGAFTWSRKRYQRITSYEWHKKMTIIHSLWYLGIHSLVI